MKVGTELERYVLEEPLGSGGMGTVYRARHTVLGSIHAIKVLHTRKPESIERLRLEARAQARLDHPNILRVTDFLEVDDTHAIVMTYVAGGLDLHQLICSRPLRLDEVDTLGRGIIEGVIAAHAAGMLHRDLKPANVLIEAQGQTLVPLIADFGLVRDLGAGGPRLTSTGVAMGTPGYAAPEQIRGEQDLDERVDVFALGATLYELATGQQAFGGSDMLTVCNRLCLGQYTPLRVLRPELPEAMVDAIVGALLPSRRHRIPRARQLLEIWSRAPHTPGSAPPGAAEPHPPTPRGQAAPAATWGMPGLAPDTPPMHTPPMLPGVAVDPEPARASEAMAPTGLLTLVFTDVKGASRLWELMGPSFKDILGRHDRILRAALHQHGGYEVKTEGDAFMLAFAQAPDAVRFCLEVQEQLHQAAWPPALGTHLAAVDPVGLRADHRASGLQVRMGVHTGSPIHQLNPTTGRMDYVGTDVSRTAGLVSLAHSGQLLISEATWERIEGRLSGVVVADLGQHSLPGLVRPEHVRQLLAPSLSHRRFPSLGPGVLHGSNLQERSDAFVGRTEQLELLGQLLVGAETRLVSLVGPGGTGKTRLAEHFAIDRLPSFPGGAWFCDLSKAHDLAGIFSALGQALSVRLDQSDPATQLGHALASRGRVLILLDNFEQLVEHAASTVGAWLRDAPHARFLVTSRQPLDIAGERCVAVDPLPLDEALELFEARAREATPGFRLRDDDRPVLREVVRRLDGLSLAVELAAARVRIMSPTQLQARLSDRFRLLRGKRRGQSDRQQTLRATIDWSWQLLEPAVQQALAQCSVFHGSFDLDAAEAVVDLGDQPDAPWTEDLLQSLVHSSMLRVVEPRPGWLRFRMLESIREYAAQELDPATRAAASLRHARHYATLGAETHLQLLQIRAGLDERRRLSWELENLVAAVDAALTHGASDLAGGCALAAAEVFEMSGPFPVGAALVGRVLAGPPLAAGARMRLLRAQGWLLYQRGRIDEADPLLAAARELAHEAGDRGFLALVRMNQGAVSQQRGRDGGGLDDYTEALAIHREVGNRRGEGLVLCNLASLHHQQGNPEQSLADYREALDILREVDDRRSEGVVQVNLGSLLEDLGQVQPAWRHYQEALAIHREVDDRGAEGLALVNLGGWHQRQGRAERALAHFQEALGIHRELGEQSYESLVLINLGDLLLEQGALDEAEQRLRAAIELGDQTWRVVAGAARGSLALIRAQRGDLDEARALLKRGEAQLRGRHAIELGKLLCKRGEIALRSAEPTVARAALSEAETIASEVGAGPDSELGQAIDALRDGLAD